MESRRAGASVVAGACSGVLATVTLQPLDLLKTRVQLCLPGAAPVSMRGIVSEAHSVRALWRGLLPGLLKTGPGVGLYFGAIDALRAAARPLARGGELTAVHNFAIGATARTAVALGTLPLAVVKSRMESGRFTYPTVRRALATIFRTEGLRGLFAGAAPTALRDAPFSGVYLACYAPAKRLLYAHAAAPAHWLSDLVVTMTAGLAAGTVASLVTQPQDVIKTRCQVEPGLYPTVGRAVAGIYAAEGLRGFFRGLRLRIFRRTLMAAVSWSVYEQLMPLLLAMPAPARRAAY